MKLDVKPYCESCPNFTPHVTFGEKMFADSELVTIGETVIRCGYRNRCENMVRYLQKQMEKSESIH